MITYFTVVRYTIVLKTPPSIQDASIDPSEVFNRVVSSVGVLLTKDEVALCIYLRIIFYLVHCLLFSYVKGVINMLTD